MIKIYVGKSASGKDHFLNEAVKSGKYERVVSYTTRPKRPKEVNGIDYYFVSEDMFSEMQKTGRLAESRTYRTLVNNKSEIWYYGSPYLMDYKTKDYVAVLDVQGAVDYIKKYGSDYIAIEFIEASDELREARAIKRGGFDKTEWDRRNIDDSKKFSVLAKYYLAWLCKGIKVVNNEFEINGKAIERELICDRLSLEPVIRANFSTALDLINIPEMAYLLDYGFTVSDIFHLVDIYKNDDKDKYRTKILDLLCECNFHRECNYLVDEDYDAINAMYQPSEEIPQF